ncbi:MAG: protein yceI precursor, partial [Candidatus Arcticimaribacter sp.]
MEACIDATTVDTDNEERDDHLRNADFFDTDKFPTICFSSTSISNT